ncbi:hypothetical protein ACPOL_3479 [Acidisarcina polymorpha]|uniref:Uncharacterized protein n=1 Tax=Acidisarcina polymorpha TaxID=2211140 RepID=A0A2Z5G1U1_9BACT|nr:hypothetical protein ACPOL_3479 [Acidisarcina polymorpha]
MFAGDRLQQRAPPSREWGRLPARAQVSLRCLTSAGQFPSVEVGWHRLRQLELVVPSTVLSETSGHMMSR